MENNNFLDIKKRWDKIQNDLRQLAVDIKNAIENKNCKADELMLLDIIKDDISLIINFEEIS